MRRMPECAEIMYIFVRQSVGRTAIIIGRKIINGPYEGNSGTFDFWDPNLFFDEDGSIYFYWGCSMQRRSGAWNWIGDDEAETEWKELLFETVICVVERMGWITVNFREVRQRWKMLQGFVQQSGVPLEQIPAYLSASVGCLQRKPFIEGPWMDKYNGK